MDKSSPLGSSSQAASRHNDYSNYNNNNNNNNNGPLLTLNPIPEYRPLTVGDLYTSRTAELGVRCYMQRLRRRLVCAPGRSCSQSRQRAKRLAAAGVFVGHGCPGPVRKSSPLRPTTTTTVATASAHPPRRYRPLQPAAARDAGSSSGKAAPAERKKKNRVLPRQPRSVPVAWNPAPPAPVRWNPAQAPPAPWGPRSDDGPEGACVSSAASASYRWSAFENDKRARASLPSLGRAGARQVACF